MTNDVFRAQRGTAILAACLAQTLNETDPTFKDRFVRRLEAAYNEIKDDGTYGDGVNELELLSWTREYLTGFSHTRGQQAPFLSDHKPR